MNSVEEQLWNYIDGTCTPAEREAITMLIATDEAYCRTYSELLTLNSEFDAMELDEPAMAFTYNVMESIRAEAARKPLKARIDFRIISGIGVFFVFTILALLLVTLFTFKWSAATANASFNFKMPDLNLQHYFNAGVIQGFLFFDAVCGLFLLDTYLRRRNYAKQG